MVLALEDDLAGVLCTGPGMSMSRSLEGTRTVAFMLFTDLTKRFNEKYIDEMDCCEDIILERRATTKTKQ